MTHDILLKIILTAVGLLTTGALTYTVKTLAGMNREQRAVATEEFVQERSIA